MSGSQREIQSGRWTREEHDKFLFALRVYGRDWKKVEALVGTRTGSQIRSHAQKYFARWQREMKAVPTFAPKYKKGSATSDLPDASCLEELVARDLLDLAESWSSRPKPERNPVSPNSIMLVESIFQQLCDVALSTAQPSSEPVVISVEATYPAESSYNLSNAEPANAEESTVDKLANPTVPSTHDNFTGCSGSVKRKFDDIACEENMPSYEEDRSPRRVRRLSVDVQ